jgi:hypothetical protein
MWAKGPFHAIKFNVHPISFSHNLYTILMLIQGANIFKL